MYKYSPLAALVALTLSQTVYAEDEHRQHDAHVHGEVELNIAQDGKELLIEITAPGADVVGFEHVAQTEEQLHKLKDAESKLTDASRVFSLSKSAGCTLTHQRVSHTLGADDDHDHDHDHHNDADGEHKHDEHHDHEEHHEHEEHAEHESSHGEFTIEYHYQCEQFSQLESINTSWFELFPSTQAIKANLLTDTKQSAVRLDKNNSEISL